jgi:hypothetical protein
MDSYLTGEDQRDLMDRDAATTDGPSCACEDGDGGRDPFCSHHDAEKDAEAGTVLDQMEGLTAREVWDFEADEIEQIKYVLPNLLRAIRALVVTAWSERDGRCWCATSPETRNGRHEPRCALARAALEPLYRKAER